MNDFILLKMRWVGYTTQHIHHLLSTFPKFFNVNEHIQFEMINEWESTYLKKKRLNQLKEISYEYIQKQLSRYQVDYITSFSPQYPSLLKNIYDYPFILFYRGNIHLLTSTYTLGVVGSREATNYSKSALDYLFSHFINIPLTIVSGLAKGADSMAHQFALKHHLPTIAVLGFGHLNHYPKETRNLRNIIEETGLVISEYPPVTKISKYQFPERNRLISGLSRGILITEAKIKSGSQITIDCALDQNRNVYVLPGSMFDSLTTKNLLRAQEGAMIVLEAEDILCDYRF